MMCNHETAIRLAEGNLATFRARLKVAADKDTVRRQIRAVEARLHTLKQEHAHCS